MRVDLLVVVDEADEIGLAVLDAGVAGEGGGLAGFKEVADGRVAGGGGGLGGEGLDDGAGVVLAIVIDDGDGDFEAGGDGGAQEAEDGLAEESATVVGGYDDV